MTLQEIHDRNILVHETVSAVCPIDGIVCHSDDKSTWAIQPAADATPAQIAAANAALQAFDVSTVADKIRRKNIDDFVVSDSPQARSLRAFGRIVLDAVGNVIAKHNANLDLMVSKGMYTPAEAAQLKMQRRDFATLMAAARHAAINETDPTK